MSIMGLHRKPGESRQPEDFYATHPCAIPPLMNFLDWQNGGKLILEPCCGQGHLSSVMETYGHTVVSTDLIDRGYGIGGVDFLSDHWTQHLTYDALITNPPYKTVLNFVEKSLTLAPVVCMFLRITFLESAKRRKFFEQHPPRYVCVFSERVPSSKDGVFDNSESSSVCYAWFIWIEGFKGKPEIVWF